MVTIGLTILLVLVSGYLLMKTAFDLGKKTGGIALMKIYERMIPGVTEQFLREAINKQNELKQVNA